MSTPVCIVNEAFVRQHLGGRDPLSVKVSVRPVSARTGDLTTVSRQIVGVIRQVKVHPDEREPEVELYVPLAQNPWIGGKLVVRAEGNPTSLVPAIRSVVMQSDKDLPISRIREMEEVAADATASSRFRAQLVAAFATLATAIAGIGLFGVLSFLVRQRAREFSVRMALGARSTDVVRLVIVHGLKLGFIGIALGALAALAAVRSPSSLLFGVEPIDPATFAAACAVLTALTIAACTAPALVAAHSDPAGTLRQE
jgi:putative ABC transport system permease protein